MKTRFFIYTIILMGSLFAACEEDLRPYDEETCWVYFDLIGSADTLQSRTFIYAGGDAETDTVWIPLLPQIHGQRCRFFGNLPTPGWKPSPPSVSV